LVELSEAEFDQLVMAFGTGSAVWPYQWVRAIGPLLPERSEDQLFDLVSVVVGLARSRAAGAESAAGFVDRFMVELSSLDLDVPEADRPRLSQRLARLLDIPIVVAAAKAADLFATDRTFRDVRVIEDLRPLFGDVVADAPLGMLLLFRLHLDYWEGGEPKTFRLTLDEDDVAALRRALSRAEEKRGALERLMSGAGIRYLRIEPR
jgi:hypothetical protein